MNILVLGMGSNVSQGIVKALRGIKDIPIHIIGACISKSSVGLYMCDEAYISPFAADDSFIPWYLNICREKHIDITFTGVEANIDAFVRNREIIEKTVKTKFVYPEKEAWEIGYDKYKTCQWLKNNNIAFPDFALASDDKELSELILRVGFPLIAKPRSGKGSSGIIIAKTKKELMSIIGREDYVVQEYIGNIDSEYTVGCYYSRYGELQAQITLHRYLKNGGTSIAEIVNDDSINELIEKISNILKITGPLNIQIRKKKDGTPVCFEWNVRYSGTTAIRNHFGFCDVEAAIREYVFNENIDKCFHVATGGVAIRFDEEMYFENPSLESLYLEKSL